MNNLMSLLRAARNSPEHPVYHPERTLGNHILLVALKALLLTNDRDVLLAAFFHDIHKPSAGSMVHLSEGSFWSNPSHAQMAAQCDTVRHAVWALGGNPETVLGLIRHHMACKNGVSRAARFTPWMSEFVSLDDMTNRQQRLVRKGNFWLPGVGLLRDKTCTYVGQSPVQQHFRSNLMTVTIDRHPYTFPLQEAPRFFTGQFEDLQFLAEALV